MARVIRVVLSILAGMTLVGGLVIAVELLSAVVHPMPPSFTGTKEEMCAHVARYPQWVLAVVVGAWSATAFVSTWVATRLGRRIPGAVVALLLVSAVACNVWMLPYPMWFKVAVLIGVPLACVVGILLPRRPPLSPPLDQAMSAEMS